MEGYAKGSWIAPTLARVHWKPVAQALLDESSQQKKDRIFLVVSKSLLESTSVIADVQKELGAKCVGVWSGMRAHTPREDVLSAANAVRAAGGADLLVSIGGGSVTDGTKAVQLCLEADITDVPGFDPYVPRHYGGQGKRPEHSGSICQIAVPTTLSGGEFTPIAGVTDMRVPVKQLFLNAKMQPTVVIFDPAVTLHTPEWLWLSTGIRAVDHCAEALCSVDGHFLSATQATGGLELLTEGLNRCRQNPKDLDARLKCQIGCWKACGLATMRIGFGVSHAIGHVLGGTADVPHGYTSCLTLPYVLAYNSSTIPEKCEAVSRAFGRPGEPAAQVVDEFIRGLGLPRTLSDVDFPMQLLDKVAELTMEDMGSKTNPRRISGPEDVKQILLMAVNGKPNPPKGSIPPCKNGKPEMTMVPISKL